MATLNCVLHPHHVSLMNNTNSLQSLFHSFSDRIDPYYGIDGAPSHRGVGAPRFNVTETETAYLLDGEVPGVANNSEITIDWLQNQVLFIQGTVRPADTETGTNPFKEGLQSGVIHAPKHVDVPMTLEKAQVEAVTNKPKYTYPRNILSERHIGPFQRSFTFPTEVDSDHMQATLTNGLLRIAIPKKAGVENKTKRINIV